MRTNRACYSKGPATLTCIWQRPKGIQGVREPYNERKKQTKKGSFTYALIQLVGMGKMEEAGHLM